jgi:hypothetical protein
MERDYAVEGLGKLQSNLHSLEFCIRMFLCEYHNESAEFPKQDALQMSENHLTNYNSLGTLIDKYNAIAAKEARPIYSVTKDVVGVRDLLAHGRVIIPTDLGPHRIFKFTRAQDGFVKIEHNQVMDTEWFRSHIRLVYDQIIKITECARSLGLKAFGPMPH